MKENNFNFRRRDFIKKSTLAMVAIPFLNFNVKPNSAKSNQICIFSKHLHWLDYKGVGSFTKQLGYDGVDLTVRKGGHVPPEKVEELLPKAVEEIKSAGVDVPMMATNINDAADPLTEKVLKTASECGIRYYRMAYYRYDPKLEIVENLDIFRKKAEKLSEMNAKYNIHGAYQNHAGNYVGASIWDLWYLLKGLDPKFIGSQFDPRHAIVEGGLSWPVDMKLIKNFISCTVMKDFVWEKQGKWVVKNVPLGEGMVDFEQFFSLYKKFGLSGPLSLHIEYPMFPGPEEQFTLNEKNEMAAKILKKELTFIKQQFAKAGLARG